MPRARGVVSFAAPIPVCTPPAANWELPPLRNVSRPEFPFLTKKSQASHFSRLGHVICLGFCAKLTPLFLAALFRRLLRCFLGPFLCGFRRGLGFARGSRHTRRRRRRNPWRGLGGIFHRGLHPRRRFLG